MDGITSKVEGLEDVTKYPDLFAELIRRKYTLVNMCVGCWL